MNDTNLQMLIDDITQKFTAGIDSIYTPYIKKIRFPRYKALIADTEINFQFPLTVLVGINGSNKTSVLQALFGVPDQKSVGTYWFSTDVDRITDEERHCFIYSYYHIGAKRDVEVLKTRIKKENNPDYWEPSRALVKYGMEKPTKTELKNANNNSISRWDPIRKDVVFCDFKEYISAFDMYFYNYVFEPQKSYKTRQEFIRNRSKKLSKVIDENLNSFTWAKVERVDTNDVLPEDIVNKIGWILDQQYDEIRIVSHKLYDKGNQIRPLKTILMKKKNLNYTEAFAGSGESRLIMLVNDIMSANENSLILIDEPEINLHPIAIVRFKLFLLQQIKLKNHQIILTTHSPYLVDHLPKCAIKTFQNIDEEIAVAENVDYKDAFLVLGNKIDEKNKIIVEDKLAKAIVDYGIIKSTTKSMRDIFDVQYLPGGVANIIKYHIYSSALKNEKSTFYVLDGDANKLLNLGGLMFIKKEWVEEAKINVDKISESENENLGNIITELTGVTIKFNPNSGENSRKEKYLLQREFLKYWNSNVYFLNSTTPEMAILESNKDINTADLEDQTGKTYFKELAEECVGTNVKSDEILFCQKQELNNLKKDSLLRVHVDNILNLIWERTN